VSALDDAVRFVRRVLADGGRPAGEVVRLSATQGIKPATLRRAVKSVGVVKTKAGPLGRGGWWEWSLPEDEHGDVDASGGGVSTLGAWEILAALVLENGKTWGECASPVQRADAEAVLASDPPARRFWIGRPRGYSKTTDAAALTIAAVLGGVIEPGERGFFCASDRDQARLAADAIAGWAHRSELGGFVVVEQGKVKFPSHRVEIEIMSSDAPSAWGRTGSWFIIDELPNWSDTPNSRSFYEAVSTSWPKKPTCRVIIIGTASSPAHFSAKVHDDALTDLAWRVSDVHDTAPWLDPAEIEGERRRLSAGSFARLWENRWVEAEDHLVTAENLARCVTLTGAWPLKPASNTRYVIGVDVGLKNDWTAIAVAHTETRDRERHVVLDELVTFKPTRGKQVRVSTVEKRVEELAEKFMNAAVFFDENQATGMIQNLRAKGVRVEAVPFTARSNDKMATLLHTSLRDGLIDLPDVAELLDELLTVRVVETSHGLLSIDTRPDLHDDMTDALGVVVMRLLERPESRGGYAVSAARRIVDIYDTGRSW
jgi:hypothetical protein